MVSRSRCLNSCKKSKILGALEPGIMAFLKEFDGDGIQMSEFLKKMKNSWCSGAWNHRIP